MSRKLIDGDFTATHELKIYRDSEWNEYNAVVRCKANGKRVASYHTDDREDAFSTGRAELKLCTEHNSTEEVES